MSSRSLDSPSFHPTRRSHFPKWLLAILAFFLLSGGSYLIYRQFFTAPEQAQRTTAVPVERTNLMIKVSANGTVKPETVINVSPKNAGNLTQLLVKEGDTVKKGQVLARMDDTNLQGQLLQQQGNLAKAESNLAKLLAGNRPQDISQAQARVDEAQASLNKLLAGNRSQDIAQAQARLESAQANLRRAESDFRRYQDLYGKGAIAQQALEQKRSDRDTAQAQVTEAQQALSLQKTGARPEEIDQARAQVKQQQEALSLLQAGTRQEDIDQARAEVTTAQGSLKSVQTQIDDTFVRASFDGIVIKKYADPGAFVTPMTSGSSVDSATSSSILSLASANHIVASVSESSISNIQINQSVKITADAYPGKIFQGKVTQIATQATVKQNVTSFEVEVAILSDDSRQLHSGMNTSVEFQVGQLENVLTVPSAAVTRQKTVTGVFVAIANQPPRFTPITTGATLNNRTEVKDGLNGTEKVMITLPPQPPAPGLSLPGLPGGDTPDNKPPGGPGGGPPPR